METWETNGLDLLPRAEADSLGVSREGRDDPLQRHRAVVVLGRRAAVVPNVGLLLQDAAGLLLEMLDADFCVIAEPAADGVSLRVRIQDGPTWSGRIAQTIPSDGTQSLAAFAIQAGYPVVVESLGRELRFSDPMLRKAGAVCAVCVPLLVQERAYGALAVCRTSPLPFSRADALFVETIGHLVGSAAARKEAEDQLAGQRRMADSVLQTVDALVLTLDPLGCITRMNRAGEQLTGFVTGDLLHRTIWSVFPVGQEANLYRRKLEQIQEGHETVEFESLLLTKHSDRKHVAWSWRGVLDDQQQLEWILATGLDVTRRHEVEERLKRSLDEDPNLGGAELADEEINRFRSAMASQKPSPESLRIPSSTDGGDRRSRPRRSYPYHQLIAPMHDGQLPGRDKFKHIACHDISSGGFSFLSPTPPKSDSFVVALGNPPDLIYLIAQVAHVTRTTSGDKRLYLIGCSYLGRVSY